MSVYFSNQHESLFQRLKENLIQASPGIFSKRYLIVPTQSIATWVRQKLAADLSIATGIETLFLDQAVARFSKMKLMSDLELALQIEEQLEKCEKLSSYLNGREKRVFPLACHLATLFRRYCIYGKNKKHDKEWQEEIWEKIFPYGNPCEKILREMFPVEQGSSFHLFLFNHLSPFHFAFFEKLSKKAPLFFYHLSPCHEFWSEMMSDRMRSKRGIVEEQHPLLANLGRLGRGFAAQVEESELQTFEEYVLPEGETNLAEIQRSMMQLELPQKKEDASIQIHLHATKRREIEGLYHTLAALMQEKKIKPSEVTVFAPDITLYAPYIKAYFGKEIDYQIDDLNTHQHSPLCAAFLQLLDLEKRRWSARALVDLFSHPLFKKKQNWSDGDLELIETWVAKSGIRWGFDLEHAKKVLDSNDFSDGRATWKEGLKRLVLSLATDEIPLTAAVLLGKWVALVESLYNALCPLYDGNSKTFETWHAILTNLAQNYFAEGTGLEPLFRCLAEGLRLKSERKYSYEKLTPLIFEALEKESIMVHANHLEAVKFCSILPMRATPSKVIVLLGMDCEAFPRKERSSGLDLLKAEKNNLAPARADFDHYFFLEALISAQEIFIASYVCANEACASTALSYLQRYVDEKNCVHHPEFAFDAKYFDGTNPLLFNTSFQDFKSCQSLIEKEAPKPCFAIGKKELPELQKRSYIIDIKDFTSSFRRPLKRYFENKLGIYVRDYATEIREEEEFTLTPLELSKYRQMSFHTGMENLFANIEGEKNAPLAQFNLLAREKVKKAVAELDKTLALFSIKKEECHTLNFSLQNEEGNLPPIHLEFEGTHIDFVGKIEGVTPTGLFTNEKCTLEGACKQFPLFLLLQMAPLPENWEPNQLFFGKDGEARGRFFKEPKETLHTYLSYYFYLQNHPSLLFPDWVEPVLEKDLASLQKKIAAGSYDEELPFVAPQVDPVSVIENWHDLASKLYGEVKNAWF